MTTSYLFKPQYRALPVSAATIRKLVAEIEVMTKERNKYRRALGALRREFPEFSSRTPAEARAVKLLRRKGQP